jgi:hypothetical protein
METFLQKYLEVFLFDLVKGKLGDAVKKSDDEKSDEKDEKDEKKQEEKETPFPVAKVILKKRENVTGADNNKCTVYNFVAFKVDYSDADKNEFKSFVSFKSYEYSKLKGFHKTMIKLNKYKTQKKKIWCIN